jgi:hypothetical protein
MRRVLTSLTGLAFVLAGLSVAAAPSQAVTIGTKASVNAAHQLPPANHSAGSFRALSGGTTWVWAGGDQTLAAGSTAGGAAASLLVAEPYIDSAHDNHTLAEVAARNASNGNTIEVGWTVDPSLNGGSTQPFLFTGAWKLGVFLGYNATATGYVDNGSNPVNAGANLHSVAVDPTFTNRIKQFLIQYDNTVACGSDPSGGWWVKYAGVYVGCYQNSIWGAGAFTTVNNAEYFGEVATPLLSGKPCSDGGNGSPGNTAVLPLDATDPAFFASTSWVNGSTGVTSSNTLYAQDSNSNSTSAAYDSFSVGSTGNRTFTYGGKGWTSTGTTPGNKGYC